MIRSEIKTVKLGDVCTVLGGKRLPKGEKLESIPTPFPYIRVTDFDGEGAVDVTDLRYISEKIHTQISRYIINKTDVFLSIAGTIGVTGIVPDELDGANLTENACRLVPNGSVDTKYLYYFTTSELFRSQAFAEVKQSAQPKLALTRIKNIKIPLPSIEEQWRIVERLDATFERISAAEVLMRRNLDNVAALQKSILHKYLSADIDTHTHRLGDLLIIERGGSPRPIKEFVTADVDGINWIKIGDVKPGVKYISSTKEKIKPEGLRKSRKVEIGDFVLSNSMSFGRPYIMKTDGAIHDGWLLLRQKDGALDKDFLYYFLSSDEAYSQFDKYAAGSTVRNLNTQSVAKVEIRYPADIEKQKEIARKLDKAGEEAEKLRVLYTKKLAKLTSLRQSLLQEAFSTTNKV